MSDSTAVTTLCGARTKSGAPCRQAPLRGRNRCRLHGGATPRGLESANTRHGRYSRFLDGTALAQMIDELGEHDPTDTYPEIELARALLARWIEVRSRMLEYIVEELGKDPDDFEGVRFPELESMLPLLDAISKMVKRERDADAQDAISRPELTRLVSAMLTVVSANVDDEDTIKAIRQGWLELTVR